MQQSSATQSLHLSFWGLRKIVACCHSSSQCLLVSTVFGTVSSLHPTSFLMIFILVHVVVIGVITMLYTCTPCIIVCRQHTHVLISAECLHFSAFISTVSFLQGYCTGVYMVLDVGEACVKNCHNV